MLSDRHKNVENALNCIRWDIALDALWYNFQLSPCLQNILADYLQNDFIIYKTNEGTRKREPTSGTAQMSILGAGVWNMFYRERSTMPEGVALIRYADEVTLTIISRDDDAARIRPNQAMPIVTA